MTIARLRSTKPLKPVAWTVILMRPAALQDLDASKPWESLYAAYVTAEDTLKAIHMAQAEVLAADASDWGKQCLRRLEVEAHDYRMCFVFEGHFKLAHCA